MIEHLAITPNLTASLFGGLKDERLVELIVTFLEKGPRPAVTTLGDMMGKTWDDDTGKTSHEVSLFRRC